MIIRRANERDIPQINVLLYEVNAVHQNIRPDLFKSGAKKFSDAELKAKLADFNECIFVAADGEAVLGYIFCVINKQSNSILKPVKTLYIDDLCVSPNDRGKRVGSALLDYACNHAKSLGCYNVTLNVWAGNGGAQKFYEHCGFNPQKITMEKII